MKLLSSTIMVLALALLPSSVALSQKPGLPVKKGVLDPVTVKSDLYPADADAPKEIAEALKSAVTDHKRVLLVFGANWCYDCHVLDRALHEGAADQVVKERFRPVHVAIGENDKNPDVVKRYQINLDKGVPVVAILASDGKLLYGSNDGEF